MFIGHFGLSLAAKKIDSRPSLGTLFLASQFIDLLWPIFLVLGLEWLVIEPGNTVVTPLNFTHYPYSHSLFAVLVWAVLFALVYYLIRKNVKSSLLLGGLVLSHWILDYISHGPDLQLVPWSDLKVGLGLWNSYIGTFVIEGLIFIMGVWIYLSVTKAQNKKGKYVFWALIIFMTVMYIMNLIGPPPPSVDAIAYVGFSQWLLVAWVYWADKNRTLKFTGSSNL